MDWQILLYLSSFQSDRADSAESGEGGERGSADSTSVANTVVVVGGPDDGSGTPEASASSIAHAPTKPTAETPAAATKAVYHETVRQSFEAAGLSPDIIQVLSCSWGEDTHKQYATYIEKWSKFCLQREISAFPATVKDFLELLHGIYSNKNLGYSAMNTARSAVSSVLVIDGKPAGQHPLVRRYLKGVFHQKPALPRYTATWDISTVLSHLKSLSPVKDLSLELLSQKLLMLSLILSGQRAQTIHSFDVRNMSLSYSRVTFTIGDITKSTGPGRHTQDITFLAYALDRRLCLVIVLKHYLERTLNIRGKTTQLFLFTRKPHTAASRDTLRRWAKNAPAAAKIYLGIFKPHSVRSASTSFAAKSNLSLEAIMKAGSWFQLNTFNKYYCLPIKANLGDHILRHAT